MPYIPGYLALPRTKMTYFAQFRPISAKKLRTAKKEHFSRPLLSHPCQNCPGIQDLPKKWPILVSQRCLDRPECPESVLIGGFPYPVQFYRTPSNYLTTWFLYYAQFHHVIPNYLIVRSVYPVQFYRTVPKQVRQCEYSTHSVRSIFLSKDSPALWNTRVLVFRSVAIPNCPPL